ncbi:hypothetical protein AB4Y43_17190 [Paraburkholderia sp. BR10872]|uniref:hypothetical protein n=1 Tax=Paraburkholderia sp. BR10872 TaxID=3236989 RepID=UPI0034D2B198
MQKILEDIASPEWWFSVVVVALLIGLAGVYLSRFLDGAGKQLLTVLAARGEKAEREREERIQFYSQHSDLVPFLIAKQQDLRASRTSIGTFSVVFVLFAIAVQTSGLAHAHPMLARIAAAAALFCATLTMMASMWVSRTSFNLLLSILGVEQELLKRREADIRESATDH